MKKKPLEQVYAEEAALKEALAEKQRINRLAQEQCTASRRAAAAERKAKCFKGKTVHRDEHGAITILDPDGYQSASFNTPELIELLYTELKKALNK